MAMACKLFAAISSRARSTRAMRPSTVIGTAWSFIDFRVAIEGGKGPHTADAVEGTAAAAAAVAPAWRKRRRENRVMAVECIRRTYCDPKHKRFPKWGMYRSALISYASLESAD